VLTEPLGSVETQVITICKQPVAFEVRPAAVSLASQTRWSLAAGQWSGAGQCDPRHAAAGSAAAVRPSVAPAVGYPPMQLPHCRGPLAAASELPAIGVS